MINTSSADDALSLPWLIESDEALSRERGIDAWVSWYSSHQALVEQKLLECGALVFRGFSIDTADLLARFVSATGEAKQAYVNGNSPRTKVLDGIYTSTEYPAHMAISLHNELSYSRHWPRRLYFACCVPAEEGGETPILDGRLLLRRLPADILDAFSKKGVMYIRNLHGGRGAGLSWQRTFETSDRARAEEILHDTATSYEWRRDGGVTVIMEAPAISAHPVTKEPVWFNQAEQFHPSCLAPELRRAMMRLVGSGRMDLPLDARFGDGTAIDEAMLQEIRSISERNAVVFPWHRGDVLVLDNMLTMHGRRPYRGPRQILISMT